MKTTVNLLELIGILYDTAVNYSGYLEHASEDELKLMLIDLIKQSMDLSDSIFLNIDLENM